MDDAKNRHTKPNIYSYLDYRKFLRDLYLFNKAQNKKYSYRYIAARAGFESDGIIGFIFNGKRNLTLKSLKKMAKGFNLNKTENKFFKYLVFMNQAPSSELKDHYLQKILKFQQFVNERHLDKMGYIFFSEWYYPAIRELLQTQNTNGIDAIAIGLTLDPKLSVSKVTAALKVLQELKLAEEKNGKWFGLPGVVKTDPIVETVVVENLYKQILKESITAVSRFPSDVRPLRGVMVPITPSILDVIRQDIDELIKKIVNHANQAKTRKTANRVFCFFTGGFPVTKKIIRNKKNKDK